VGADVNSCLEAQDILANGLNLSMKLAKCLLGGDQAKLAIIHNSTDGQISRGALIAQDALDQVSPADDGAKVPHS